ncbi:diphosphomevalonate decarboxylase-like [Halichondria panicea]|uniref:diphosphomevalonate decarboxylase-like n=1 Tax=Halichondria panicea TaxID=6063 RepID=UPI00312B3090
MDSIRIVTCSAPVNIAVIKYWGKRDERLILPTNSSLSVCLDQDQLKATTSVALSNSYTQDKIWINGREECIDNPRLQSCLREVRRLSREQHGEEGDKEFEGCVHICSVNNFPTAAGLASSAAGYACLVFGLSKLFKLEGDISRIARQGSGSACRSVLDGFIKWERGERDDGSDSMAVQVCPSSHWPGLEVVVLVVSADKKQVSSSVGMQSSVLTSPLMSHRVGEVVPRRMVAMETAIQQRDFQTFAQLTMKDSNQFHAICLDTYPPIFYLNDTSRRIIHLISRYNQLHPQVRAAYTFDAGPNAVLMVQSSHVQELLDLVCHYFPPSAESSGGYVQGLSSDRQPRPLNQSTQEGVAMDPLPGALQYIIHTKVGEGPRVLDNPGQCLLGQDGLPKTCT